MASFDLTAQLQLQAPTNTNAVIGQIKNQLKGLNVPVNVQANTQAIKQTTQAINNVSKSSKDASKSVDKLGNSIKYAARRFGAFAVGTQILGGISSGFAKVTKEAIQFEKELNKIRQITGKTEGQLASLSRTITDLSRSLGVSSNELLGVAKTLSQAGFAARDVEKSLRVLAQTTLGSSFNTIAETTEGAIAILRQFDRQAQATGDASKFLEQSLDAINAVSKRFAVESSDIIQAVRRVGGVFSAAGGEVNELIALFTSIRATTRESAETIAVGLRTIFSRLQRVDTIEKLQGLGIQLQDLNGQFVGPLKAIEQLAGALGSIDPKDFRVSEIVEELGGIRQVGKVIPLIYQYATAQQALEVANASSGSIAKDAALAQLTLANQFAKTGEAFADLARKFTQSKGFKDFASQMLQIANAVAKVAESLIPLIPLVTQLGAAFAGIKLAGFVTKGVGSILGKNSGGKIHKFARGGFVPGTGNSDTVPAMLQPGEFVIKKSSAQKLGADTLNRMNNNKYKEGGKEDGKNTITPGQPFTRTLKKINLAAVLAEAGDKDPSDKELDIGGAFLQPGNVVPKYVAKISEGRKNVYEEIKKGLGSTVRGKSTITDKQIDDAIGYKLNNFSIGIQSGSLTAQESDEFQTGLKNSISSFANSFGQTISGTSFNQSKFNTAYQKANIEQVEGNIFEAFVNGLSSAPFDNTKIRSNDTFDFSTGLGENNKFGISGNIPTDAKRTFDKDSLGSLANKGATYLIEGFRSALAQSLKPISGDIGEQRKSASLGTARQSTRAQQRHFGGIIQKFEAGGSAGTDTVPALLTPGEYVINKSAAQSIGYKNLNSMNETGVARFATGGAVGVQRFASGGAADNPFVNMGGTMGAAAKKSADALSKSLDDLSDKADDTSKSFDSFKKSKDTLNKFAGGLQKASFGLALAATTVLQFTQSTLGLSDQQAAAAQEAIGFATIVAGAIGTLISWVTSINTATAAEATDTAATNTHAAAVASDTAAIKGKTAADLLQTKQTSGGFKGLIQSINPLTAVLAIATVAFIAVVSALKYNASILRQEADKSKQAFEDFIEKVRSGEQGAGNAAQLARDEAEARAKAQAANNATTVGAVGAGAGILAGAAAGAAIGSAIPVIGTAIGAAVGAIVGAAGAYKVAKEAEEAYLSEYQRQIEENIQQLERFAVATATAAEVQANIEKGLKAFQEEAQAALPANATEEQRQAVEQRRVAQSVGLVTSEASRLDTGVTNEAFGKLAEVAKKLDKPVSQLTEADITAVLDDWFPALNPAEASAALQAIRAISEQKTAVDSALQSSRQVLGDAAALEIDGTKTFQQLINSGGAFAQALKQTETLIRQQSELRIAELKSQRADLAAQGNQQGVANIDAQIKAEEEGRQRSIDGLRNSYEASANFAIENRKAAEAEAAFRSAMVRTIKQFELMDSVLTTVENSLNRISEASQNYVAALTDGQIKFGNTLPENFGDITNTGDPGQFQAELETALRPFGAVGQKLKSQITSGANILETARQGLGNIEFKIGEEVNATQLLAGLGLNKANLGEEVFNKISNDLRKAAKDGGTLTEEQIQEIFAPALEESKRAAEQAKRLNEVRNRNLEIYSNYVDNMKTQFERELSARQKVIDVELQNAEILAAAGVRGEVSRQEREQSRTQRAQIGLTGTGLAAGDIQGAADLIAQSIAGRQNIAARQEAGIAGPQDVRNLAKFNTQIGQATAELERLADQSDRVADIQADIEKERAKRGAIEDIAGDFVFGGQSARESINAGLAGVQAAFQTGTVQNQSEEQRQATLQTLDRLQSIPFFKDLKQNLIKADAARLGIDPAIADALFNPTTEEQRLQQELIAVTQQRTNASMALAQLEAQKTQDLINSEQQLINALGRVEAAILNQDPAQGRVGRATGGIVRGPGSGTSDSILASISNGEFVVNAAATAKNRGLLEDINEGKKIPGFAGGSSRVRSRNRRRTSPENRQSSYGAAGPGVRGGVAGQAAGRGRSGSLPRDDRPSAGGGNGGIGGGAAGAGGRASQSNLGYAAKPEETTSIAPPQQKPFSSGIPHSNVAGARTTGPDGGLVTRGKPGEFSAAMASSAPTSDQDVFGLRGDENRQFSGSGFAPTYVQPVENKPLPTTSVADHPVRGKGSGYYARQVASESIRSRREQRQSGTPTNAYDMQRQKNLQAYQTRQSERARMFGGDSAEARMNRAQLGRMQAMQMQNRYNARAANFNASIAQSQMAFRQQAAQFVGAGALQGAGGRMLTGGGGYMAGGGGYGGGQMGQQQTNNMVAAANNNGGGMQSMNGMTINHNVTVSGMISVGGLNIQAVASAVTQSIGQMVVNEVSRQMKSMNQGFRTGT